MSFQVDPNPIIGPAITFTPWHPMSFSILHNELRRQKYDEAFRRQVINPFN